MNKRRAAAAVQQAELHQQRQEWDKVAAALEPVVAEPDVATAWAFLLLAEAYGKLDRLDDTRRTLEQGFARHPKDAALEIRLGVFEVDQGRAPHGIKLLEKHRKQFARNPTFLNQLAVAQLKTGRTDDAEATAEAALQSGGGDESRIALAMVKGRRGQFEAAEALVAPVAQKSPHAVIRVAATAMQADCRLFLGDAAGALGLWKTIDAEGRINPGQLGHMAYAAQLAGETELATELIARSAKVTSTAEDELLFAQVFNLRNKPDAALQHLEAAERAPGEHFPGFVYEVAATRGRAQRLLGRSQDARATLFAAASLPEHRIRRVGARVRVDLGHLSAESGDFETAEKLFTDALEVDPGNPEAIRALELTRRRTAWRSEVQASAEAQVEAARAEAEALKRHVSSREGELEEMRRELERLRAEQKKTEAQARKVREDAEEAVQRATEAQKQVLRSELEQREKEIDSRAREELDRALGEVKSQLPDALQKLLLVSERTYQKALYTELPAAAVAVLYSGALERGLIWLFVERFETWLNQRNGREAFLAGAIRERRGNRVEYFDRFVEAFDRERAPKAPSMGEVGRVLERRHEPYLAAFLEFLRETYAVDDALFDQLASYVQWSKEKLRDPTAHGRGIELGYEELKAFREQLLFAFAGQPRGVLALILSGSRRM